MSEEAPAWKPRTALGRQVFEGRVASIEDILRKGLRIKEPEIVDWLLPDLKSDIILIGGRRGKGGGIQRIPIKITARMTKSGRRFRYSALIVVGNEDGIVGVGRASSRETRAAIEKATRRAKLNLLLIKRGCGSWECGCKAEPHSIPYRVEGKSGSVRATLMPAPKGVGLVANDEVKKLLRLAGIKDVWTKLRGDTRTRTNVIYAVFDALRNLYVYE